MNADERELVDGDRATIQFVVDCLREAEETLRDLVVDDADRASWSAAREEEFLRALAICARAENPFQLGTELRPRSARGEDEAGGWRGWLQWRTGEYLRGRQLLEQAAKQLHRLTTHTLMGDSAKSLLMRIGTIENLQIEVPTREQYEEERARLRQTLEQSQRDLAEVVSHGMEMSEAQSAEWMRRALITVESDWAARRPFTVRRSEAFTRYLRRKTELLAEAAELAEELLELA